MYRVHAKYLGSQGRANPNHTGGLQVYQNRTEYPTLEESHQTRSKGMSKVVCFIFLFTVLWVWFCLGI